MRFDRVCFIVTLLVFSGSPESRTQRRPVISRAWATGPRLPFTRRQCPFVSFVGFGRHTLSSEGVADGQTRLRCAQGCATLCQRQSLSSRDGRTRTCVSVLPKHVGSPLPYIPLSLFSVRTGGFEPPISWSPTRRDNQASLRSVVSRRRTTGENDDNPLDILLNSLMTDSFATSQLSAIRYMLRSATRTGVEPVLPP